MVRRFGIGGLAAETGRSVHTIRWYERQGLLPGVTRDAGRRRVYMPEHVQWLTLMDRLRQTGMSIAEMRRYTALVMQGRRSLQQRQAMLTQHRARVTDTIAQWKQALRLIDHKIDFYGAWLATGVRPREIFPRGAKGGSRQRSSRGRRPAAATPPVS
jgi:DNA-binding transcriptional MerR regulator